ncbi:MAG: hypothetical protein JWN60_3247 [Acidobacteria bacterium]|jgi:hypothetical protein|nr:hypothetical protein [Acidobacteriota bacterium]
MWNKIYLACLAVLLLPMLFLSFYAGTWLKSIGSPQSVVSNYEYYSNLSWNYLWLSTGILLILGNIALWKTRKSWALWATFLYFSVFIIVRYFWLERALDQYKQSVNFSRNEISFEPLLAVILCAVFAGIVFFDNYLVKRLSEKMNPVQNSPVAAPASEINETKADENI